MRRLAQLNETASTWRVLERRVHEAVEMAQLAEAEPDAEISAHVEEETLALESDLDRLEFQLAFGGPYDVRNAIVAIHAGAGGTESQDWAEMLLRMYLRWCENRGFATEVLDSTLGEEAGVKSVTLEVHGGNAYGYLRSERGVHRLVRLSPFDGAHARHTSFALVEVMPEVEAAAEVDIREEDLRIDIYHSAGHGGQNVQKGGHCGPDHTHPHGDRRNLSERAIAGTQQGVRAARAGGEAAGEGAGGEGGGAGSAQGRAHRCGLG